MISSKKGADDQLQGRARGERYIYLYIIYLCNMSKEWQLQGI